ncbi:Arginine pathway regulatory protein ArgR2C repressor of arg regulon [gamma proteobacterium IMCC2047]|nr:Arginine pathway regulatory protein ArgR2C repressor of arg regulon [gamma proteobacterium IMCC2047]
MIGKKPVALSKGALVVIHTSCHQPARLLLATGFFDFVHRVIGISTINAATFSIQF